MENKPTVKELRYKYELPMIILGVLALLGVLLVIIYMSVTYVDLPDWLSPLIIIFVTPILASFFIRYFYWDKISNGVEITQNQLPEIYEMYIDLAIKMGFKKSKMKIPRLYLVNGNGVMNAFASKCTLRKGYIVIHSDLLDLAYKFDELELIKFVLAHELGHHKCGHTKIWRTMLSSVLKLAYLDKSLVRTQEYTADRVALYYAKEGAMSMIYIFSGKYMGSMIDMEEYFNSIDLHDDSIWLKLSNFLSDHPVGFRRMQTLKKAKNMNTWNVHGKFF